MGVMTITHQFGTFNHIKQSQNTLGVKYGHYSSKTIPKPRGGKPLYGHHGGSNTKILAKMAAGGHYRKSVNML